MDQSKINVRYAKAFFSLGKEKNQLNELKTDVELISSVIRSSNDFMLLLETPIVKTSQKEKVIRQIFQDKVQTETLHFLSLIVDNKREAHLPGICRNFLELIREEQNIRSAVFTSAIELDPSILQQIATLLEKEFESKVEISGKVDSNLIGGFVLRVDDRQYDASIASQLSKIKETLLNTEVNN